MHPAAWIVWAAGAGIVAISTTNPFYLVTVAAAAWLVYAARGVPGPNLRSFRIFLLFGLATIVTRTSLVLLGPINEGSVAFAFLEGLRLAVVLVVFGTFNSVTDPFAVLRLSPRRFHEPALAAALALSIAPRTVAAVTQVRDAQRARGLRARGVKAWTALAVPVLETGMEDALTLAESMDARGHGRGRRTHYRREPWTIASLVASTVSLGAAVVYVAAGRVGFGDTAVSTYPLRVPEVSFALVLCAAALALPAILWERGRR